MEHASSAPSRLSLSITDTMLKHHLSLCVRAEPFPLVYSHTESSFSSVEEPAPLLLWCGIRAISWCDFSFGPISALHDLRLFLKKMYRWS